MRGNIKISKCSLNKKEQMKRKTKEKVLPFLKNGLNEERITEMIWDLDPQVLSEAKDALDSLIKRADSELSNLKTRNKEKSDDPINQSRFNFMQTRIDKMRITWSLFATIQNRKKAQRMATAI